VDFLVGEATGLETMYPPGSSPVQFHAYLHGSREECERFLKVDYYAEIPGIGIETFRAELTYSDKRDSYVMWCFSASQEEPAFMQGNFIGEDLIMVSEPWPMPWGLQRIRNTYRPLRDGGFQFISELWEPDGYAKYCTCTFAPQHIE
jgi:hypothetical protein